MRRYVTLAFLLLFAIPFGASLAGCSKASAVQFCNGQTSGVVVGQTTTLNLEPRLTGISLSEGQIGRINTPSAQDCRGQASSASNVVYGASDLTLLDVSPSDGRICAGSWNRNSGGGIPDYTVCTPNNRQGVTYVTASAEGVVSNALPVYVHPVITGILLGPASTDCVNDPASNCNFDGTKANGCSAATPVAVNAYSGTSCLSQGKQAQLAARSYKGTSGLNTGNNISCLVGPVTFSATDPSVVTIDTNGLATATQPGSSTINATISQSSSSAGFFSTCPPQSIVLAPFGITSAPNSPVSVNQNTPLPLTATVKDINGVSLTNIQLEFESTSPTTIPAGSIITPIYPGTAAITAVCQPPACNNSPFNEIGLFGNGTPVTSNPVQVKSVGTDINTVLYVASTQSQYLLPYDFTLATQGAPVRLPFAPNSLVLSEDQSTIYMGTSTEIMVYSTSSNVLTRQDTSISGLVLAASPDNSTVIVTDPVRKLTYLYSASGGVITEYGGVGTRAEFSPDSQTVYITTSDKRLLVHSAFTGWSEVALANQASDVAVTVPNAGVYLGGNPVTARTNCPATTVVNPGSGFGQTTTNVFYPQIDVTSASADRLSATNDGVHFLGANTSTFTDIKTNAKAGACPVAFTSSPTALPLAGVAPTVITGVLPTSDSAYAFVTFQGTGGAVPQYAQGSPTGTLTDIPLQKTATGTPLAPVAGVISANDQIVFVGTSGDNEVHRLARGAAGYTDTLSPINPALPNINGSGTATPDLLAQRPRKSTS